MAKQTRPAAGRHPAPPELHGRAAARQRRAAAALRAAVAGLIGYLVATAWLVDTYEVTTGSMAPSLWGRHCRWACPDCGWQFAVGADDGLPLGTWVTCPNCGFGQPVAGPVDQLSGDRLLVDRSAFAWRRPRRWETVAFRSPDAAGQIHVKRVVGLPGERLELRDGDVYADDRIVRKTLDQQQAVAIIVHDSRHTPTRSPALPLMWSCDDGRWQAMPGGFRFAGGEQATADGEPSWLAFRPWRRSRGASPPVTPAPIENVYGYNQVRPVLSSRAVADLMLRCRVRLPGGGPCVLRAADGRHAYQAWLPVAEPLRLLVDGRAAATVDPGGTAARLDWARGVTVEMSLFDRQVLLALDGTTVLAHPLDDDLAADAVTEPFAIGSPGPPLEVSDLVVLRDVYYSDLPDGRLRPHPACYHLDADQWLVLGDNSPLSHDSRAWQSGPALPRKLLLGKPLVVHYPSRPLLLGPLRIQVPDPERIRYIR